jgi:hypothetical protein
MFSVIEGKRSWSSIGIKVLIGSIVACVALSLIDGYLRGPAVFQYTDYHGALMMLSVWTTDFRYLAEQAIYAATIFVVGAKFIETRTIFSIGFDKLDTAKISFKGPDDENVIWIGHRHGTRLEAEAVAAAFEERLKESAVA